MEKGDKRGWGKGGGQLLAEVKKVGGVSNWSMRRVDVLLGTRTWEGSVSATKRTSAKKSDFSRASLKQLTIARTKFMVFRSLTLYVMLYTALTRQNPQKLFYLLRQHEVCWINPTVAGKWKRRLDLVCRSSPTFLYYAYVTRTTIAI